MKLTWIKSFICRRVRFIRFFMSFYYYYIHVSFVCLRGIFAISPLSPLYTYWSGKQHFHISQMTYNFIIAFSFAIVYMCIFTNKFFLSFSTRKERKKRKKKPLCGIPQDLHWSNKCMYFKLKCEIRKRILSRNLF